jgi:hypothetical protein
MLKKLIEDKELEKLLGEDNEMSDDSQSVEEGSKEDQEEMPKAAEAKEEDSQVEEKAEDSQVDEKADDSQVEEESDCDEEDEKEESYDFSEDVKALNAAGEGLSEEFKTKAASIFEAAVTSKLATEKNKLQESYKKKLSVQVEKTAEVITERVDSFLNYVVSNWMEENKVAIESGLRTELAETFMSSLKKVFTESYIEVPESKKDLYAELETKMAKLEESARKTEKVLSESAEKLKEYQRKEIISEASQGLAATQVDRLNTLVKDIEFISEESFKVKVKTIKESYFKPTTSTGVRTNVPMSVINEGTNNGNTEREKQLTPEMKAYASALSRVGKKPFQKV